MESKVQEWINIAEEDLSTAEWCVQGKKYLWAMVMCQQAIEKLLKAIYQKQNNEIPPKIHNLIKLSESTGIFSELNEEFKTLFDDLLIYYFSSRYPDKSTILKEELNESTILNTINKTKEVYTWLKEKL